MVSPEGFEPSYFVTLQVQTAVIGTFEQQVVICVMGYSRCSCPACAHFNEQSPNTEFSLLVIFFFNFEQIVKQGKNENPKKRS